MDCSAITSCHSRFHHHRRPQIFPQITAKSQIPNPNFKINFNRRSLLLLSTTTTLTLPTPLSFAGEDDLTTTPPPPKPSSPPPSPPSKPLSSPPPPPDTTITDRITTTPPPSSPSKPLQSPPPPPDTTITDRIYMDFSACSTSSRNERTLGDEYTACEDTEILGRVVFGLYGKLVPITVSHFKAMCTGSAGSSYKGTIIQKIFPGKYFIAGKQGSKGKGEVIAPVNLSRNTETVEAKAFGLKHFRPGVVSLCLSENDDEDDVKFGENYRNVEFLVTTGPAPCPELDGANIVFGTVLEGMDVVTNISTIPTYKPSERIRQFNDLAEFFGDERASNARSIWNRPLKTVFISDCGELKVAKPAMSPSLP